MAKLKDQSDAIKRAITMMQQDMSKCILLGKSKKDLAYIKMSNALKRKCDESKKILNFWKNSIQFQPRKKKKKLQSSLNLLDKIQDFLHTFVFKIQFSVSVVYDGYGGMFVNIRYSTEIMTTVIVIMMSMEHLIIEKHSSAYHTI